MTGQAGSGEPFRERSVDGQANAPTVTFENVLSLCEEYAQEQGRRSQSSIDSYLERVAADAQPTLLRNLVAIDLEHRRAAGEHPRIEEYLERFPQFASLIRETFLDVSSVSSVLSYETEESLKPKVAAAKVPGLVRLHDYRLLGELGRGGMGVVYEAVHLQRGHRVALKTLPSLDGAALHRFKREFRALADINHPNLVGLQQLENDGCHWFFTMDLVEGVTFSKYVRPGGLLDESRLRAALTQLVAAVMALHGQHIIHRDLKPSNVMVTHDGHVVVLDFGLVLELDHAGAFTRSTAQLAGTPRYMAPEQAAGEEVTAASDWYAVGVLLYESLCGYPPFQGPQLQVLQDKQRLDPPPLPDDERIPQDLAELCLQMLARDPEQRPDAFEIVKTLAPASSPEAGAAPQTAAGHRLVGREPQLAALEESYHQIQVQREPLTVFISGRSGEGKTSLADEFLAPLRQDKSLAVMSGRCYDRESVPFKALDTLIDALASYLRSLPAEEAALLMPDDIGMLVQVFPVLQRVDVVAKAVGERPTGADDQQVRQRAFRALRLLLNRISRRSLIVWCVDDLQWGDADSAEALFEVLRPPEAPALLFVGIYRSDETEGSAFLKKWKELQRRHDVQFADREVKVSPLTIPECTELVVQLVGKDDDRVRRRAVEFAQETGGNPFLLIELVGCFDAETDSFEPLPLHEVLARKLQRLPEKAGHLLDVVAVSGQGLSLEEASRTAGHQRPPMSMITRMRNERLVRLVGPEESPLVDTYHDRVRETALDRMDPGRCRGLHRTLAEVVETDAGGLPEEWVAELEDGGRPEELPAVHPRVYDLAYHFDAAGEPRKAWRYALFGAEQARRQSALEVAANNYALAARNAEDAPRAVRCRIAEGWAEALMLLGRYEEALQHVETALELVGHEEGRARIEALQGEIAFKQGAMDKSAAFYEQALRRLGYWVPQTTFGFAYGILRETAIQTGHSLWPGRLHRTPPNDQLNLSIRLFFRLGHAFVFQNTLKLLWAHLAGMNRAELPPPSLRLAYNYATHNVMMMLGWHARGHSYGDRAIALAREFDDVWGQGHSCNYRGIGLYASARYEEGLARLAEAVSAFEKAGDLWELHLAHFHKGCCHFGLGQLAEAVEEARWTFASSARLGDSRTLCSSYLWARATRGNIPFEELESCYPDRPDDVMSTVHGIMAEGHWHTYHGRAQEALEAFERAAAAVRKNWCVNSHMILVLPELAAAVRRQAEVRQRPDPQGADHLRRRADWLSKWAVRATRFFPAAYPLALRERSRMLGLRGKTEAALQLAEKSCAVAEGQNARFEYAQSQLLRGQLMQKLGQPGGGDQIESAEAALDEMERPLREMTDRPGGP